MKEFSKYISEKWNISESVAKSLCECFEKEYSPWYCADHVPHIAAEAELSIVFEIYDFLNLILELQPKKKRLINALKKNNKYSQEIENQINLITEPVEIEDLLLLEKANPRSKAQIALKKGLGECAKAILNLTEQQNLEELINSFVGTHDSLKTPDDVIAGIKDIITENFAYDVTARAIVREFIYDGGILEIVPKNKNLQRLAKLAENYVIWKELSKEDLLYIFWCEDNKDAKVKLNVQLFRITELLKHHFKVNIDSPAFPLISEAIDECWLKFLKPAIEEDVKKRIRQEIESYALNQIGSFLEKKLIIDIEEKNLLICGLDDNKNFNIIICNNEGRLLAATSEKRISTDKPFYSERLKQSTIHYKPYKILCLEDDNTNFSESIAIKSLESFISKPQIERIKYSPNSKKIADSQWIKENYSDLELSMRKMYSAAIEYLQPPVLISCIGPQYFSLHPLQEYVSSNRISTLVNRIIIAKILSRGINIGEFTKYILNVNFEPYISKATIKEISAYCLKNKINIKDDLLKVPNINEKEFRNIAGYIIIPSSDSPLDRTLVHPEHFTWIKEICNQLKISVAQLVNEPEIIHSYQETDFSRKIFIEKKLLSQLKIKKPDNQPFVSTSAKPTKRLRLNEIEEGSIVSGRVTNITPFGVFVNINAVCDGLIHISQLADAYIESPEQVVKVGDEVKVRIIKVDPKKRRISLSMKGLHTNKPRIAPSKRQLSDLANHFQNR